MSRINTNVASLIGVRVLNNNNNALSTSLERLSTGLKINRGSDDPAGLIASENLRKQIRGTETAMKNAERAINIISTAEGSLQEISAMLLDIEAMLSEAANTGGMSTEEIDANQLQVDSILNTVDRIANTTEFAGIKLLNGNQAYSTSSIDSTYIDTVKINAAKLIDGATMTIALTVTTAAETGLVRLSGVGLSGNQPMSLKIGSNRGTTELSFAASTSLANMLTAINEVTEITGVSAALSGATTMNLRSVDFGTRSYVTVETLNGAQEAGDLTINGADGDANNTDIKDFGVNAIATINGSAATADGKILKIRTAMLDAEFDLETTAVQSAAGFTTTLGVTSGGANFSLGASVDAVGLEAIGIQNVASSALGNATLGYLNTLKSGGINALTSTNLYTAQRIVDQAVKDVSTLRGRLGSFQKNTLTTTINSLAVTNENLYAAESAIRDTDFATETAKLTKSQILVNAATSVLAQANFAPQSVLQLLG